MPNDHGPVVQSALLRNELVRLRKVAGLTQEQVAADREWSPSKLIRVEGGRSSITRTDLEALLGGMGQVTYESRREQLQTLNRDQTMNVCEHSRGDVQEDVMTGCE